MTSPQNFKGAVLVETAQDIQIWSGICAPDLQTGQVLVKVRYAGLCHSQLMEARGGRGHDPYVPHFLGHEGVGEVIEIGAGVTKVKAGDQVIMGWIKGEGLDGGPCQYRASDGTQINSGAVTVFSEYAVVSENRLVLKPPFTPDHLAILYGCALPTGAGLVLNELKPHAGSDVAVIGLGGIGISALMAAKSFNPRYLIAIDIEDEKLALAKEMGATHTLKADDPDIEEKIKNITDDVGVDYAVEAAGLTKTIEMGFRIIKRGGGSLIFASHPKSGQTIEIDPYELICGKSIRGTWGGGSQPDRDIPLMDKMYQDGHLKLEPLLSHRYQLEYINQALNDLEARKIVRALIEITPES